MTYKNTRIYDKLLDCCEVSAKWLELNGYKSVEQMVNRMIDKAVEITEMSPEQLARDCGFSKSKRYTARTGSVFVPDITIYATPISPTEYGVEDKEWEWFCLPDATSDRCLSVLPETDRRRLQEMAERDMSPAEERSLYDDGDYDVIIDIDAYGNVTYWPC